MRKTKKLVNELLAELEKTGIASNACSKVGLPRATYYRWREEDLEFRFGTDTAIEAGRSNMVDFAESKLVKNMNEGQQRAIEYYLKHNDDRYRNSYAREFNDLVERLEHKHRENFKLLDSLPNMLTSLIPSEALEKILREGGHLHSGENKKLGWETQQEVDRLMGSKYMASIFRKKR